jgi:hypothetical protein
MPAFSGQFKQLLVCFQFRSPLTCSLVRLLITRQPALHMQLPPTTASATLPGSNPGSQAPMERLTASKFSIHGRHTGSSEIVGCQYQTASSLMASYFPESFDGCFSSVGDWQTWIFMLSLCSSKNGFTDVRQASFWLPIGGQIAVAACPCCEVLQINCSACVTHDVLRSSN